MAPDHHERDRELDDLIRSSRRSFIARHVAGFDVEAGLADVRERASHLLAEFPASRTRGGRPPAPAAVVLACDHIDDVVALLGELMLVAELRDLIGGHVRRAGEVLLQVRSHVAAGSMSAAVVADVFAEVSAALGRADQAVSMETGRSLEDAFTASRLQAHENGPQQSLSLASLLRWLEQELATALAPGSHDLNTGPTSTTERRQNDAPPGRRRAGGNDR
jgi:hypothetical protein